MAYTGTIQTFIHGINAPEHDANGYEIYDVAPLASLCAQSRGAYMRPFSATAAEQRPLSISLVSLGLAGRTTWERRFLAHAAITGFDDPNGEMHARIGSVIVDTNLRGQGLGLRVVQTLMRHASEPDFADQYGLVGFTTVANDDCVPLMTKAGLHEVDLHDVGLDELEIPSDKHFMVRTF